MSKIGFIGLGIMGTPMASNLLHSGHELFVHTRSKVPEALVKACFRIGLHMKDLNLAPDVLSVL
jgi:3-hydroxyisobutyrate dehydrogenase-like beta-hydroxyacid dehydrogenase